jgi:hypothetical protein
MPPERDTWQYIVDGATVALPLVAILVTVAAYLLTYLRRPRVSIEEDKDRIHSHLEGADNNFPHVRLLASNRGWRRAAHGTQVIVVGYRRAEQPATEMISLGSPTLGWPSANAPNEALTIFPGMSRPIDFGSLYPALRSDGGGLSSVRGVPVVLPVADGGEWVLRLGIGLLIADQREFLLPGEWIVRLVIGANDGSAATYDVHVAWNGDEADPQSALDDLLDHLEVLPA